MNTYPSSSSSSTDADAAPPRQRPAHRDLVTRLVTELVGLERATALHCRTEARRLGDTAPAGALRACSRHADDVTAELATVSRSEELRVSRVGPVIGSLLSALRSGVMDRLVENERSYRSTLGGLRQGIDLVRMLRLAADASARVELGGFCTRWLERREQLVAEVERALGWFAHHPDVALRHRGVSPQRATGAPTPASS